MPKGSDLFVAALVNEGVGRIFGVPGRENLDSSKTSIASEERSSSVD
jgi:thiamine pyrophosphate-dependent acetolactate synthase large subunit-like protein